MVAMARRRKSAAPRKGTTKSAVKKRVIKKSNRKVRHPSLSLHALSSTEEKPSLFRISSPAVRLQLLEQAASRISFAERSLFPSQHGGRSWTCTVNIEVPNDTLLFHISDKEENEVELACLPDLLEQIATQNTINSGTIKISRLWYSPNLDTFRTRKLVLEHIDHLKHRDNVIDKCLFGTGIRGTKLKTEPSKKKMLEAGLYRFLRDGLWVSDSGMGGFTKKQVDLCFSASTDHFERVMYTVKARALYHELNEGFDLLRERGKGRFDMEIPAFDSPKFSFLTSKRAPWISAVRQILGKDANLVHKGCFLSLPGSAAQVYHQDGVHLCADKQKSCHAVNVFFPLCDMTELLGPTEFCLGSHYLGSDYYVKENCIKPLAKAGMPIMFDYRLGHRGLANRSDEARPVVYLTYTVRGFKDKLNFSRKRYHKLGSLVGLPVSREERAKKRADTALLVRDSKTN